MYPNIIKLTPKQKFNVIVSTFNEILTPGFWFTIAFTSVGWIASIFIPISNSIPMWGRILGKAILIGPGVGFLTFLAVVACMWAYEECYKPFYHKFLYTYNAECKKAKQKIYANINEETEKNLLRPK